MKRERTFAASRLFLFCLPVFTQVAVGRVTFAWRATPYELEQLLFQEGEDMITLFTLLSSTSGSKQRYVMHCERSG